jgi:hypothetical protein
VFADPNSRKITSLIEISNRILGRPGFFLGSQGLIFVFENFRVKLAIQLFNFAPGFADAIWVLVRAHLAREFIRLPVRANPRLKRFALAPVCDVQHVPRMFHRNIFGRDLGLISRKRLGLRNPRAGGHLQKSIFYIKQHCLMENFRLRLLKKDFLR